MLFEAAAACNQQPELPAAPPEQDRCVNLASFKLAGYCCQRECVCVCVCVRIPTWYLKSVLVEFILLKEACLEKLLISSLGEKNKNHTHIEDLWKTCMFTK